MYGSNIRSYQVAAHTSNAELEIGTFVTSANLCDREQAAVYDAIGCKAER